MSPNQDITLLQQCTLVQTWVDTQGQEERGHGDQAQPRHHGEPHHEPGDRGELCDPPTAPPSTGVILVTSLYRGHYGVLLSLVSPHIIQVTSHPGHLLLLITIHYISLSLSPLSTSLTPGCWQLTATCQWLTRPGHWPHNTASSHQRPSESVAILGCYKGSDWSSHQHWGRCWPMMGPDTRPPGTGVLIRHQPGLWDAGVACAVLTVRMRCWERGINLTSL